MRFAIYAYDKLYGGKKGKYDVEVVNATPEEIDNIAKNLAYSVINNNCIYSHFEDAAEEAGLEDGTPEFSEYVKECYDKDIAWKIREIREDVPYSNNECLGMMLEDYESFFADYCQ